MGGDRTSSVQILSAATATGAGEVHRPNGAKMTFQAIGVTSSGAGSSDVLIQASLDNSNWVTLATISLTLSTTASSDGFAANAPWEYIRANVSTLSGTGATIDVWMGVEK